ncbi:MAG: hypothetical protein K2M68_06040 [Muribaculaceae bacterium]|nr:hypothetical protein [Muribaculaceae bacterium]
MKKNVILGLCVFAGLSAAAQTSLVKEVERNLKAKPSDYPAQVKNLQPAFTNEETANTAYPYFVAGKGGYDYLDNQQVMQAAGQNVDLKAMGHSVIDGYGYLVKALSCDTVVDAKGKAKTKYSKDIIKLINNHYNDFNTAAVYLWEAQDYDGAYQAWELCFSAPENPVLGANAPKALPDSILNVYAFNQGLAAYNLQDWDRTLVSFDRSIALGNTSKNVYDYAIAAAYNYPDSVRTPIMAKYAQQALPLYGAEDNAYIGYIINDMLQSGKYNEAEAMVKQAIAATPDNAQLYYILGVLYENKENDPDAEVAALEQFKKCVSVDPNHANGYLQLGYLTFRKAEALDSATGEMTNAEYNKYKDEVLFPVLREAAKYLEKCYELDPENGSGALANLRNIYYALNDAENLQRIENIQKGY